ncbi:MAG: GAF domain-containing protein [bacterium]
MGEGRPGVLSARVLDESSADAAIAQALALHDLDASLERCAQILLQRFAADALLIRVYRQGRGLFWAPLSGPLAGDTVYPDWQAFRDPDATSRVPELKSGITPDLAVLDQRSSAQQAAFASGLRSSVWCALTDERGDAFGYILSASISPNTYTLADLGELERIAKLISRFVRPAVLIEERTAERTLLRNETALLAAIAEAETEDDLSETVVQAVQEALQGDIAFLMVEPAAGGESALISSPADAFTKEEWEDARKALAAPGNSTMNERSRAAGGAFSVTDLAAGADSPVERWLNQAAGIKSLVSSNRSHQWGGLGLGMAVGRREVGAWTDAQRSFLARVSRVLELSIERLRRGEIAVDHTLRLERHADLLATGAELLEMLSAAEDLEQSCNVISARIRAFFDADHVAFGMLDLSARTRTVLGFSSDVMAQHDFSGTISENDVAVYAPVARTGTANVVSDLATAPRLNDAAATLQRRGVHSLMRAPFHLSDGSVGIVTVGSRVAGKFSDADGELLIDLCRPVGIAIDRVRLIARMAEASDVLGSQTRILAALTPGATIESAGQVFVNETVRLFGATHAVAALFDTEDVRIVGIASDIVEPQTVRSTMRTAEYGANWRKVLDTGEPQLIEDFEAIERSPAEEALFQRGLRSMMRVPIKDSQGIVRGIVTAGSPAPSAWRENHLATFIELSGALALVHERSELYEKAEERAAKVQALTRLLSTLNLNSPPEEVARLFATQVRQYLGADAVMVYAFDLESQQRVRVAFDAAAGVSTSPERINLDESNGYRGTLDVPLAKYSSRLPESGPEWLISASERMGYQSSVCVRLDAAGEAVGMIAAGSLDPNGMGQAELEILSAVASPLGMVLERARAVTTLRLQTQRTRAVLDILAALGPADTIEQVAGPVANALRMMYGADHCAIGAIEGDTVSLVAIDSEVTDWNPGDVLPLASLWGETVPTGPVIHVIHDLMTVDSLPEVSDLSRGGGMRSSMRVLIGSPVDPLGVVTVGSRQPNRFSEFEARQLAQIVQPLAVAARYFRGRRETEVRTERLETTNRILTRLSAGGTAEHLARGFLAECRALFNCSHSLALQFDAETDSGRILAIDTDITSSKSLPSEFTLGEMHSARLVRQPTPHLVLDAREEPVLNTHQLHLIEQGLYSAVRAPLVVHDTVRGAVSIWGSGVGCFSTEDAELLGTLTRPLALALEKASALESLGESELKYRSLVAQADEMIFLFDPTSLRLLDANTFTSHALNYSHKDLLGLTLDQIMDSTREDISRNVAAAIDDGELHLSDARFIRSDSGAIDVDAVASMVTYGGRQAVLVLARDVSERKALMRQLIQSQKMDSLGAMAGAVAHDFNNLLTTILGFAGLLKRSANMDSEERENLALIEDAARRAADLTGRLLSFSRGGLVRFGRVDLRTVIEDTLQLAEPTMHSGLKITRHMPPQSVLVEGDAGQLQQSLTNIILNARDAMPEGGDINVRLRLEGTVAVIEISDTGPGMTDETRMRIFEPFYTTKPVGSGTGLGMAITYGIIQGHHGDIAVQSEPGNGTSFTISLPILDAADATPMDMYNAGEGNLVLVVDDDAMVRRTTTATLAELGYNVVEAPGGATAVEILRARPDRFSVVLLDLVMPGMTGSETFRALTAIRADIPVVVCTGYAAESHIDTDVKRRIAGLVQKPFTAERLSRALLNAGAHPTRPARI